MVDPIPMSFSFFAEVAIVIMAAWGFYKVIMEIIKAVNERHDKEQKWDEMEERLTKNIQDERDKIYARYDFKLEELEGKIDDNHCDTEAKIQQLKTELQIQTECIRAILDGLHQLNCNGPVTEAREKLDDYLVNQAHR